jgi:hypothetical protein
VVARVVRDSRREGASLPGGQPRRRERGHDPRPGGADHAADSILPSELPVGPEDGLPVDSVASFDNLQPFPIAMLTRRLGRLDDARLGLICRVAAATLDC